MQPHSHFVLVSVHCATDIRTRTGYTIFFNQEQIGQDSTQGKSNSHCMKSIRNRLGYVRIHIKRNTACVKECALSEIT